MCSVLSTVQTLHIPAEGTSHELHTGDIPACEVPTRKLA